MILTECYDVNEKNNLTCGGADTVEIAKEYGTPCYVIDENTVRKNCRVYKEAMKDFFGEGSMPLYASKALSFKEIYRIVAEEGLGIDVVSPGELYTAKSAGFPMEKAYFHGNNKTDKDIDMALDAGIGYFVVDNREELDSLDEKAGKRGIVQKILLRITPGIDPHTHKAIMTGNVDSKFGTAIETGQAIEFVGYALTKKNVQLDGFHIHIGSQIFEIDPFCDGAEIMIKFIKDVYSKFGVQMKVLNLGGGFGVPYVEEDPKIDYRENIKNISERIKKICADSNVEMPNILMEPGRSLVAAAGLTLYTVGSVKEITGFKNYVSIDGGMPDNPRYALYSSQYTALIASRPLAPKTYRCTIAGRCCESGDLIAENIDIQPCKKGDILAVLTTGAYNYSMASNYNRILKPPVIMVKDGNTRLAVKGETFEDLIRNDL